MVHTPKITVDDRLRHIAFIMDGNGRWATKRGLIREMGHKKGAETFRSVTSYCHDIGIKAVTVYVLSTENLIKRPEKELSALMDLLRRYLREAIDDCDKNGICFRFPGDRSALPEDIISLMNETERITLKYKDDYVLNLCINYGGQKDIIQAVNRLIAKGEKEITEEKLAHELTTSFTSYPELIVRTGGDIRLSNFLLWECAYSELYFTDTLWPDMNEDEVDKAIESFYSRQRRYGAVK